MDPRGVKLMYPMMVGPLNRGSTMLLEQERRDFFDEFLKILGQPKEYYRKVLAKYLRNGTLTEHLQGPDLSSLVREATRYLSSERTTTGYTCFEALQVLLEIVPSIVEACDYHRRTALSYAAEFQNAQFTELLLRHGANPHAQDEGGRTPLSWAATLPPPGTPVHSSPADAMVITHLLKNGADVNSEDHSGRTPLILAAKEKSYDLIELLIDNGANSAQRDMDGCTCFWWLLEARRQQGLRPEGDSADRHRVFLLVQKAYKSSVRRDKNDRTPLSWAVEFQDFDMVAALLYAGADPETSYHDSQDYWETPFLQALGNSNGDIMRLFIRLEIVVAEMAYTLPARNDKSSLHRLIKKSHWIGEEKALKLLEKAIELQYVACRTDSLEGKAPLHYAIGLKKESLALKLIDNLGEVELNVRDNNGKTPLLYALEKEMWNVAQRLVQRGANIDLSQPEMWFNLGTPGLRYIRFTRKPRFSNTELIYQPPNQRDWLPNGKGNILCFHEEKDSEWSRLKMRKEFPQQKCEYIHHACLKSKNSSAEWMESHISVLLPNINNFWGIEWSVAEGKGSGFVTTIPSSTFPESWKDLCEQFLRQLHEKWENICVDAGKAIENIRQKQLKNQGQNRKIIYNLAQSASTRAEFRLYLQQHVLGLKEAVKNNSIIKAQDEKDLIGTINHINEFVKMRLDGVEQAGKELLQMELAWISISEASSIKRISWVTFIFLPLMFASSLFGMNVNLLENNPDWRWYLAIGALFLLLTVAIWMIFKVFSTESWKKIKNPWAEIKTFGLRTRKNPTKKDIYDMNSKV